MLRCRSIRDPQSARTRRITDTEKPIRAVQLLRIFAAGAKMWGARGPPLGHRS